MEPTPISPLELIFHRLRKMAEDDLALRRAIGDVARTLLADVDALDLADRSRPTPGPVSPDGGAPPARPESIEAAPPAPAPAPAPSASPPVAPLPPVPVVEKVLRLGDGERVVAVRVDVNAPRGPGLALNAVGAPHVVSMPPPEARTPPPPPPPPTPNPIVLTTIARRCRLRAEACRWTVERPARLANDPDAVNERDRDFVARAKAVDANLWMLDPARPPAPPDAAGSYDALAEAADAADAAVRAADAASGAGGALAAEALQLLAEAQSAVRVAVAVIDPTVEDYDQRGAHLWLKHETRERGIYIERHMRMDDGADPAGWADLRRRVAALGAAAHEADARRRSRVSLLGKARYHAGRLVGSDGGASTRDWETLAAAIEALVAGGLPPSDLELRAVLLPVLDDLPDVAPPPAVCAVLAEVDRYLATENAQAAAPPRARPPGPAVRQVNRWLRGKRVVLIGGDRRPRAKAALEAAFELAELDWLSSRSHQSFYDFESAIAHPTAALVLLAIRWSSHSFGEVKTLCDRYGKPFVRLPGGYNPEQVAQQIVQQVTMTGDGAADADAADDGAP